MLLELLNHHHELFMTAIWPLIDRRNCADVRSLANSCRQIQQFLAAEVPFYTHMRNYRGVIKDINHIEKIIFVDDTNNLGSIMNIHGKLIVYVIYSRNPTRLSIYNENENSKEIKDINYTQLYEFKYRYNKY